MISRAPRARLGARGRVAVAAASFGAYVLVRDQLEASLDRSLRGQLDRGASRAAPTTCERSPAVSEARARTCSSSTAAARRTGRTRRARRCPVTETTEAVIAGVERSRPSRTRPSTAPRFGSTPCRRRPGPRVAARPAARRGRQRPRPAADSARDRRRRRGRARRAPRPAREPGGDRPAHPARLGGGGGGGDRRPLAPGRDRRPGRGRAPRRAASTRCSRPSSARRRRAGCSSPTRRTSSARRSRASARTWRSCDATRISPLPSARGCARHRPRGARRALVARDGRRRARARTASSPPQAREAFRLDELVADAVERARRAAPTLTFTLTARETVVDGVRDACAPRRLEPARQRPEVEPTRRHDRRRRRRRRLGHRPRPRARLRGGRPPARLRPLLPLSGRTRHARARGSGSRSCARSPTPTAAPSRRRTRPTAGRSSGCGCSPVTAAAGTS